MLKSFEFARRNPDMSLILVFITFDVFVLLLGIVFVNALDNALLERIEGDAYVLTYMIAFILFVAFVVPIAGVISSRLQARSRSMTGQHNQG